MALIDFTGNPSLNEIVSSLAARVNKQHDEMFMDELKHIVNYKRSKVIHDWLASNPNMKLHFIQSFVINTERTDATECPGFPTNCYIFRTVCEIPEPIRDGMARTDHELFEYVGSQSGYRPYQWYQPEFFELLSHNRYTKNRLKWYWKNRRIYILNLRGNTASPIMVRSVFEDALALQQCDICTSPRNACINNDDPYPIPRELLNDIVRDILAVELRPGEIPDEQKEDSDTVKVDSQERIQHVNT